MSTIIGQVDINLRMSLAQFKKDVQDGTDAVRSGTKGMADDIKANTFEARGTLMLLGEEIGVHIPRHLQRMIAELPGVGPALATAFSSVAVLAAIEVIAKVIEKIQKYREEAQKTAEAWTQMLRRWMTSLRRAELVSSPGSLKGQRESATCKRRTRSCTKV